MTTVTQRQPLLLLVLLYLFLLLADIAKAENVCFETKEELMTAINDYMQDPSNAESEVAQKYGHPMKTWCVGKITNFDGLFANQQTFNEDLGDWDTSSVTSLQATFERCVSFTGGSIDGWDVSKVINFHKTFIQAVRFAGTDLSAWDVSNAQDMSFMFYDTPNIQFDLSQWNVGKVTNFESFASAAKSLFATVSDTSTSIANWDVSKATNFKDMFARGSSMDQNLCAWGQKVQANANVENMFGLRDMTQSSCPDPWDPTLTDTPPGPFCWSCLPNANPDGTRPGTETTQATAPAEAETAAETADTTNDSDTAPDDIKQIIETACDMNNANAYDRSACEEQCEPGRCCNEEEGDNLPCPDTARIDCTTYEACTWPAIQTDNDETSSTNANADGDATETTTTTDSNNPASLSNDNTTTYIEDCNMQTVSRQGGGGCSQQEQSDDKNKNMNNTQEVTPFANNASDGDDQDEGDDSRVDIDAIEPMEYELADNTSSSSSSSKSSASAPALAATALLSSMPGSLLMIVMGQVGAFSLLSF